MLIKCPECELQVSNKATTCPHCGYPLRPNPVEKRKNKRRRLPNGFGQISQIKNQNLRNPFRAMVCTGKNEFGRPICKLLKPESYFPTYNDAYSALVEYHKNPYDLDDEMTLQDLYTKWITEYAKTVVSTKIMKSAWKYCSAIHTMRVKDVRARHIKSCMENGTVILNGKERKTNANIKNSIKSLMNMMLDYALEYELVDKNYARTFSLNEETLRELEKVKNEHIIFTEEEMGMLWKNAENKPFADMVLIQCYTGWRPQELCLLKLENIDLENGFLQGGMKTEAGANRIVPIHSRIQKFIELKYKEATSVNSAFLFFNNANGYRIPKPLTYHQYLYAFTHLCEELQLNPKHRPHDARKHFVSMAKKYQVDEYAIKYIVGHRISDITEKVYTERELDWLKIEIEKIL